MTPVYPNHGGTDVLSVNIDIIDGINVIMITVNEIRHITICFVICFILFLNLIPIYNSSNAKNNPE